MSSAHAFSPAKAGWPKQAPNTDPLYPAVQNRHAPVRRWLLAANLILLFVAAVWCRAAMLDRVPGLNGDEAWQGVQVQQWLRGAAIRWRTPTGNPINPLTFFPMAALHVWLPPSITLLRLTPLVSGLLALALNYVLCRRILNWRLATISTLVLAVLPATIAYSRFAWDASQTLLVTLPVVYCSLGAVRWPAHRKGWLGAAAAALGLALLVHPTNVFLAPLIVTAAAWCWRDDFIALNKRWISKRRLGLAIVGLFAMAGLGVCIAARPPGFDLPPRAADAAARLVSPAQAVVFIQRCLDLLSGTTVYRFIPASQLPGTDAATLAYCAAAWALALVAGFGVWQTLRRRRRKEILVLAIGLMGSLAAFYVVAGPGAIQPHFERYGMWMLAPGGLLLAIGLNWWMHGQKRTARIRPAVALLIAWVWLAGFGWYYFRPLLTGSSQAHVAFRTSSTEPKRAALHWIRSQSPRSTGKIVAAGWWLYWPLKYLAGNDPQWLIVPEDVPTVNAVEINAADINAEAPVDASAAWRVQTVGPENIPPDEVASSAILDAAGRPIVWILPPAQ